MNVLVRKLKRFLNEKGASDAGQRQTTDTHAVTSGAENSTGVADHQLPKFKEGDAKDSKYVKKGHKENHESWKEATAKDRLEAASRPTDRNQTGR
jgi:hypothetical protein